MRAKDYDLLITDLKMPEVNGYEVLELLRTSEIGNSRTIPVVAATAAGYVEKEELTGKGFAAVLYKPYSIDELLAVTESCIKRNKANSIDLSSPVIPARLRRQAAHVGKAGGHNTIRHGRSEQGGGSGGHGSIG